MRYRLLDAALYLLPPWSTRRRRRLVAVEGPPPPPEEEEEGGEQQPVPRPTRSGHLLRGSGISAIRLLYLLPRRPLRWHRRRRRRQATVTCPPPPPPPLVDENRQPTSPSGHLLRDISLVRGAQVSDFKSG